MGNRNQQIGELLLDEDGKAVYCTRKGRRGQVYVVNGLTFLSAKDATDHFKFNSKTYIYNLMARGGSDEHKIRLATWEEAMAQAQVAAGDISLDPAPAPVVESAPAVPVPERPKTELDEQIARFHSDREVFLTALREREQELIADLAHTRKQIEGLSFSLGPVPQRVTLKPKGK